jgi:tetratricopeptide (TPR) repeat protein
MLRRPVRDDAPKARRPLLAAAAFSLLLAALAARLHNAWASPALSGYDAFGHFTYVWYLAETGRVPLATEGWSFFHPPLYYALMASLWKGLAAFDPLLRLKVGKVLVAALGVLPSAVAWWVLRRRRPAQPRLAFLAAAAMLLVPVQLYSSGFLGNEGLHAVAGSLALAALVAALERPTNTRAALLGLALGAAMLVKASAFAIVAGAFAALALQAVHARQAGRGALRLLVVAATLLLVAGPYYARNVAVYGQPFQLSRGTFLVSYVEDNQPRAARGWADYLTFDPLIFRRPSWPRGAAPDSDPGPYGFERSVRESVWTGLYANAWFDGFGGWVLPSVVDSERARRAGQALLTLGLAPTLLMLIGMVSALAGLRRRWDDTTVAFAAVSAAMGVLFVYGTREAPIAGAVKATYLTPVGVVFAYWFAAGVERFEGGSRLRRGATNTACALVATISLAVFWQGFLFDGGEVPSTLPGYDEARTVQRGIVEYAGGNVAEARRAFEEAAERDDGLAWENLAFLALDEGRDREGLRLLRRAAALQSRQPGAGPIGRERFLALTEAEHLHSIAVVLHGLGRVRKAAALWTRAIARDPGHAEALWALALSRAEDALRETRDTAERRSALEEAARLLAAVRALDPGLKEGWTLGVTLEALRGDCAGAEALGEQRRSLPWWTRRNYPFETGTGAGLSASIGRRRLPVSTVPELDTGQALLTCGVPAE